MITKLLASGVITGPPQLKEYPVDPVGVAIISPSAQYEFKYSLFKYVSTVIIDVVFFLLTAISLSAKLVFAMVVFSGRVFTLNNVRSEIL